MGREAGGARRSPQTSTRAPLPSLQPSRRCTPAAGRGPAAWTPPACARWGEGGEGGGSSERGNGTEPTPSLPPSPFQAGRIPGTVLGLPGNEALAVTLPAAEVDAALRAHGRRGLLARVFDLRVRGGSSATPDTTLRVLPRQVHASGVTGAVENVNFLLCPPTTRLTVRVPVVVLGDAVAPGVKRGGYLNLIRRDVRVECDGGAVPDGVRVDVSRLELGQGVPLSALRLPPGVRLVEDHVELPVLKIAGRQSRE